MGLNATATAADIAAAFQMSLIYCSLLVILGVLLSFPVMLRRFQAKVGLGDGGDRELLRRMRIHGNFIEQAALGLPVLLLLPLAGAPVLVSHLAGITLLVGRLLHAQGLFQTFGTSFGRAIGMISAWIVLIGGSVLIILYALSTGTVFRILFPG